MDCSLPGSSVHGILQARILDWVAISFSRGSSQCRDGNCVSYISCIANSISVTCLKGLTSYAPSYNSPINKGRIILSIYHVTGKSGLKKKVYFRKNLNHQLIETEGWEGAGKASMHLCVAAAMTSWHAVPSVVSAHGQIPGMTSRHPVPSVVSAHGQIPAITSRHAVPSVVSAHGQIPAMTSRHACCPQRCEHSWAGPHMLKLYATFLAPESRWDHQCDLTSESIQMKGSVV